MFFKVVPFYFFQTCAFFKIKKVIASILSPSVTYHFLNNVYYVTNWAGKLYILRNTKTLYYHVSSYQYFYTIYQ